jgi:ATP-dependent protease HslVU (ClpYQ) ATPase subunit
LDASLGATTTHKVVINVVEALSPSFQALLLEINELSTEPTPEAALTIATNATGIDLSLQDIGIRDLMIFLQMILENQSTVTHLGTGNAFNFELCVAAPSLDMEMLRVFVSFPIILTVESFAAV